MAINQSNQSNSIRNSDKSHRSPGFLMIYCGDRALRKHFDIVFVYVRVIFRVNCLNSLHHLWAYIGEESCDAYFSGSFESIEHLGNETTKQCGNRLKCDESNDGKSRLIAFNISR